MHFKRAIGISVLIYIVSMVLGMIVCSFLGITPDITQPIPMKMWLITAIISVGLSVGGAFWYFQNKAIKPSLQTGLQFGGSVVIVGFVLDLLFFLSLSTQGYEPLAVMSTYYRQPPFWITLALILVGSTVVGKYTEKQK